MRTHSLYSNYPYANYNGAYYGYGYP
ncbi:unnamed protein product, partial [Rotaria sp. Silwood1]